LPAPAATADGQPASRLSACKVTENIRQYHVFMSFFSQQCT
jgi:hypothetical protein